MHYFPIADGWGNFFYWIMGKGIFSILMWRVIFFNPPFMQMICPLYFSACGVLHIHSDQLQDVAHLDNFTACCYPFLPYGSPCTCHYWTGECSANGKDTLRLYTKQENRWQTNKQKNKNQINKLINEHINQVNRRS